VRFCKLFSQISAVKNLMYGFGDDRNPANDTVNVMEEILVEFITDIVRVSLDIALRRRVLKPKQNTTWDIVSNCWWTAKENTIVYRRRSSSIVQAARCEEAGSYGGVTVHAGRH
jgi:hypothetical protein